nr:797_t:CDS:2 [Entrophospora candida]
MANETEVWDSDVSTIKITSQILRTVQPHICSDYEDIITSKFDFKHSSWKDFKDEYQGVSKGMFSSRTDGTFLGGMFLVQNAMIKIGSPKMILLQPIEYNAVGGKIILVDGKKVLESVLWRDQN